VSSGYPVFLLKVNIDENFVGRVVEAMGGKNFDGTQDFPEGVRVVDFLVGDYCLEFKRIEKDPLVSIPERIGKVADFAMEKAIAGETPTNGMTINLKGAVSQTYWRKYAGVAVGRLMEDAAEQLRSTREHLKCPDLKGAVFIVNVGAPFIDAESLNALVGVQQERFKADVGVALFFNALPSAVEGSDRPVVMFGFHPNSSEHDAFAEEFERNFAKELAKATGKDSLDSVKAEKVKPMRFPFSTKTSDGTPITFH
jgi:hypothetical protein